MITEWVYARDIAWGTQDCRRHPKNLHLRLHHGDRSSTSHISGLRIGITDEQEGMREIKNQTSIGITLRLG